MTIDLRYILAIGAFFAPALAIKVMFWFWGVEITAPKEALVHSIGLGTICFIYAIVLLFIEDKPIPLKLWEGKK